MAEIKIRKMNDEIKIDIPNELENSKIGEKFVATYFDAQYKVIIEQAQAMQLRHQNECELEKQKRRYRYWFGMFVFIVIMIAIKFPIKN